MNIKHLLLSLTGLFLFFSVATAQNITVKGKVTDSSGPIPGVTVSIKGGSLATVTDANGYYQISAKIGDLLEFKFVGFISQEVKVTNEVHDVELLPDNKALGEVVVVAYSYSKQRKSAGYSSAKIGGNPSHNYRPKGNWIYSTTTNNEKYNKIVENKFKRAKDEPLSTFSIDVDAASYSNVRRNLNQGQLPQKDAVRTEELINYFSYDYEQPTDKEPILISTEVNECPWNTQSRLVRVGLKAKEIPSESLPKSNFVFLIDVSGSMEDPNKLDLIKSSLKLLVNNLREKDRVAIVVYAGAAGEVLPSTSGRDKQKIWDALSSLNAGGSTAGGEGIQLAYKIARQNFIANGNNRIILCTDGDFNVGPSGNDELEQLITKERESGVFLTVLGYGMGNYKDSKMQVLAEKGNGNHAYIDNLQEAQKVLVNEFGSKMYIAAKDVKLQIEFNPVKVQSYRLIGYESRLLNKEDFNDDTKDAGEMGAGQAVTALYEVVPSGAKEDYAGNVDKLKYQNQAVNTTNLPDLMTVKLRYKLPEKNTSQKKEVAVVDNKSVSASSDFNFAAAVAMYAQLLRNSEFKGKSTYNDVIELAKKGLGNDDQGYRREFVRLVETTKGLGSF